MNSGDGKEEEEEINKETHFVFRHATYPIPILRATNSCSFVKRPSGKNSITELTGFVLTDELELEGEKEGGMR
jgi:hypothetical protein